VPTRGARSYIGPMQQGSDPSGSGDQSVSGFDLPKVMTGLRRLRSDWPPVAHVAETASTNADAIHAAMTGATAWSVFVADHQTAGRGRLGRSWQAPAGSSLLASVILRPPATVAHDRLGWVPLLVGLALTRALRQLGAPVDLKWPNDVVAVTGDGGIRKVAGVLSESHLEGTPVIVAGFGVNTTMTVDQLPVDTATSLTLLGSGKVDRGQLLVAIMGELVPVWDSWARAEGDAVRVGIRDDYENMSVVTGREIRVSLPDGRQWRGKALGVDEFGHLRLEVEGVERMVAAGDVIHVRC